MAIINTKNLTKEKLSKERPDLLEEIVKDSDVKSITAEELTELRPDLFEEYSSKNIPDIPDMSYQDFKDNYSEYIEKVTQEKRNEDKVSQLCAKMGVDVGSLEGDSTEEKLFSLLQNYNPDKEKFQENVNSIGGTKDSETASDSNPKINSFYDACSFIKERDGVGIVEARKVAAKEFPNLVDGEE